MRLLLSEGARPDVQNCDGSTPLHMACACEHRTVATTLLQCGASATLRDADGCTALELAPPAMAAELAVALAPAANALERT